MFKTPGDMFLHLETGTCTGEPLRDEIEQNLVKLRGPWKADVEDTQQGFPICCWDCNATFRFVSSFLQHIESDSCQEGYFSGRQSVWGLLRQLRRNLKLEKAQVYGVDV